MKMRVLGTHARGCVWEFASIIFSSIFYYFEESNGAACFAVSGMFMFYRRVKASQDADVWRANPLRLLLPMSVLAQMLYWLWFGILADLRPATDFDWMLPDIPPHYLGYHFSGYLITHYIFFVAIDIVYGKFSWKFVARVGDIRFVSFGWLCVFLILINSIFNASLGEGNYLSSIVGRFFPTAIGVLSYYALVRTASAKVRWAYRLILLLSVFAGYLAAIASAMRFALFHQILIFLSILIVVIDVENRRDLRRTLWAVLLVGPILFFVTTANKIEQSGGSVDLERTSEIAQFVFERSLQRLAPFTTDGVIHDQRVQASLFSEPSVSVLRIAKAIPFLFGGGVQDDGKHTVEIEKRIYSLTGSALDDEWNTSIFISGASESVRAFGLFFGVLILIFFGCIHGFAAAVSVRMCGKLGWINLSSHYVLYALLGIDINNFLRLPINILLGSFLISFFLAAKSR